MKKRILSLLLAALLCAPALAGCSNNSANPDETESAAPNVQTPAAEAADTEEELSPLEQRARIPDNLPDSNFDGRDFTVCTEERKFYEIFSEDLNGEATNDSVYQRNVRIEDRFNVKIKAIDNSAPYNDVVTNVTSGTYAYDLVGFVNFLTYVPASAGVLYNWLDIPRVDLTQPWHNQLANGDATINGKLYGIDSDLSISTLLYTYGTFFNYNIMEQYGFSSQDLYDIVFEGKWTVDRLREISSGIWQDLNGDGKHDPGDIHGYAVINAQVNTHDVWLAALDISPVLTVRGEDDFEVTFFGDKTVSALEKVNALYHDSDGSLFYGSDWRQVPKDFSEGKIAMTQLYFGETTESLTEMEDTYGILPLPKFDEMQEGYYTNCWDQFTVFAVPLTMPESDGEFVGTMYEVLSAESYKTVFPAYYDVALKSRYSAEPATAEVIDLIMAGRKLDFTFQFGEKLSSLPYMFRQMVVANDTAVASKYQKIKKSLNKQIQKFLQTYYE
ncbi:MAG: hypothetical protein E7576_04245 [Ruminococcaceae bacterium]|jgi:ABC-type glycerol-3-phosphate transport system substrate-binding protein|nr:hypothetical protein [Oscillospiraceae bacterium]